MEAQIIEAIKDVHNTLGYGFSESIYQKALTLRLQEDNLIVEREKSVPILFHDVELTTLRADLVVNKTFIIELKAITSKLSEKDVNQIKRYMKILNIQQGILVNFNKELETKQIKDI